MPKIDVLIPTFERPALLRQAMESVLSQDFRDFRLLIVDNASADDTSQVAASFQDPRVVYRRHSSNIGLAANFLKSLGFVESPYFCWLGDDDLYQPAFLSRCAAFLDKERDVDFVWTRFSWFYEKDGQRTLWPAPNRNFPDHPVQDASDVLRDYLTGKNQGIRITCQMFRSDWFNAGRFSWGDSPQFDIPLRLELLRRARRVGHINDVLFLARQHEHKFTNRQSPEVTDFWRLDTQSRIRAFIHRERSYLIYKRIGTTGPLSQVFKEAALRILRAHNSRPLSTAVRLCLVTSADLLLNFSSSALALLLSPLQIFRRIWMAAKGGAARYLKTKGTSL